MRKGSVLLLVGLLDGHGSAHAIRARTVLSELAFAVPPPTSRPSAPAGRHGVCPLTSTRRGKRASTATAAATRGASVRIEPLEVPSSSSGGGRKVRRSSSTGDIGVPSAAASRQQKHKPKRSRSPRRKAEEKPVSSVAGAAGAAGATATAAAAAAVNPFPAAGSEFVAPLTGKGGSSSGSGGVGARTSAKAAAEAIAAMENRAVAGGAPAAAAVAAAAAATPAVERKSGRKLTPGRGRTSAVGKAGRYRTSGRRSSNSSSSSNSSNGSASATSGSSRSAAVAPRPMAKRRRNGGNNNNNKLSAKRAKALRTGGRAFYIVCDAESITFPELMESIDLLDELGTRDVGVVYADWKKAPDWRSELFGRSKARDFELLQRDPLPPGSNPLGDDTMTAEVVALARSGEFKAKKYEFCLLSADGSLAGLAARLRQEGAVVRGVGRRQAPEEFLQNCDAFMYVDPANRFELLDNDGLVISVALCIALAAAGLERCDWVRMKTIVNSLRSWDLGLESPNDFGYSDYGEVVVAMDAYVTGVEDTSGELVVKVPPKPKAGEVPRGLEDVATYLYQKWVSFTEEPRMNDILLACIPACLQALSAAREETELAVRRFHRNDGVSPHGLE